MLQLVGSIICPFVQRVAGMLEAGRIPWRRVDISLADKPDWFLAMSPNGQVPVLITERGTPLFESEAIVGYLEEAYPPLLSGLDPEERALHRAWGMLASKNYLAQCSLMHSPDRETFTGRRARLDRAFDRIEARLGEGPYFAGERIGTVDIAWLPLLHRAAIVERHTGEDLLGGRPRLRAWQQALARTGLFERSVTAEFEDRFIAFYLSEETRLGRSGRGAGERPVTAACCAGACC